MHLVKFFNHLKSYNEQSMASHLRRAASGWESLGDKLFLWLSGNKSSWNVSLSFYEMKFLKEKGNHINGWFLLEEPSFRKMAQGKEQPLHSDITTGPAGKH